jgi:hypothetical protein
MEKKGQKEENEKQRDGFKQDRQCTNNITL